MAAKMEAQTEIETNLKFYAYSTYDKEFFVK